MEKNSRIFVAGHRGLAGSAIRRELVRQGYTNLSLKTREVLDLTRSDDVEKFFATERPEYVFLAAAKVFIVSAKHFRCIGRHLLALDCLWGILLRFLVGTAHLPGRNRREGSILAAYCSRSYCACMSVRAGCAFVSCICEARADFASRTLASGGVGGGGISQRRRRGGVRTCLIGWL